MSFELIENLKLPIGIVANDAGGANHIASWFENYKKEEIYCSINGPAKEIFKKNCRWLPEVTIKDLFTSCNTIISGTGWASTFEHDARKLAKEQGCYSIAVIDHWTNYQSRFARAGEIVLPDAIWVTDEYAEIKATKEFPETQIIRVPNMYIEKQVHEILERNNRVRSDCTTNILYLLEPMRIDWCNKGKAGEFQALDFFVENLHLLNLGEDFKIKLRPHPSDSIGKYSEWLSDQICLNIELDDYSDLADTIAWADIVVGCETYAMVVSLAAGKRVISSIPPWADSPCILPQTGIVKLYDLVK